MNKAFNLAFSILKALPEQQQGALYPDSEYGRNDEQGTAPPTIHGMVSRMNKPTFIERTYHHRPYADPSSAYFEPPNEEGDESRRLAEARQMLELDDEIRYQGQPPSYATASDAPDDVGKALPHQQLGRRDTDVRSFQDQMGTAHPAIQQLMSRLPMDTTAERETHPTPYGSFDFPARPGYDDEAQLRQARSIPDKSGYHLSDEEKAQIYGTAMDAPDDVGKALNPSPHHMDEGLDEEQMRHFGNMQGQNKKFQQDSWEKLPQRESMIERMGEDELREWMSGLSDTQQPLPPNPAMQTLPPNPPMQPPQPRPIDTSSPKALQIKETYDPNAPMTDEELGSLFRDMAIPHASQGPYTKQGTHNEIHPTGDYTPQGRPMQKAWQIIKEWRY